MSDAAEIGVMGLLRLAGPADLATPLAVPNRAPAAGRAIPGYGGWITTRPSASWKPVSRWQGRALPPKRPSCDPPSMRWHNIISIAKTRCWSTPISFSVSASNSKLFGGDGRRSQLAAARRYRGQADAGAREARVEVEPADDCSVICAKIAGGAKAFYAKQAALWLL